MEDEGKLGIIMEYQGRTGKTGKNMEDNGKRRKGLLSAVTPAGCKPGSTSVSTNDTGFPLTAAGMTALSPKQAFEAQSLESRASFADCLNQICVRHLFNKRLLGAIFFAGLLVYLSTPFV